MGVVLGVHVCLGQKHRDKGVVFKVTPRDRTEGCSSSSGASGLKV